MSAEKLGIKAGVAPPERPSVPQDYRIWSDELYRMISRSVDIRDARTLPFTFGRSLGEVQTVLVFLLRSFALEDLGLKLRPQIEACQTWLRDIVFRMSPCGALLGTDAKTKPIEQAWQPLRKALDGLANASAAIDRLSVYQTMGGALRLEKICEMTLR